LLDGLTGIGLLTVSNGRYTNTPESSSFLVKGKPAYFEAWPNHDRQPHGMGQYEKVLHCIMGQPLNPQFFEWMSVDTARAESRINPVNWPGSITA